MKKQMVLIVLGLAVTLMISGFVLAQGQAIAPGAKSQNESEVPIVVTGKIAYMKQLGGYFVSGAVPAQEYMIENQNPQELEKLLKSAKEVRIEGRRIGAELLIIEKINGKPYTTKPSIK
jgi:hypothetical protein